jgi:hypothetical protein
LDSKYNIINAKKVFLDMQNCVGKIDFMFSQEFQNSCRLTKLWNLTKVTIGMEATSYHIIFLYKRIK